MSADFMFKLLVVGESGVGKTCMLLRFADNSFEENFLSTIGVDFKVKQIVVDEKKVKLQIWDSAGQERFKNITASYYRNCSAIIIVYDITSKDSFNKVSDWVQEVRRYVPSVPLLLVGNKCDLEHNVSEKDILELAKEYNAKYFEVSVKNGHNFEKVFDYLIEEAFKFVVDEKARLLNLISIDK